MQILINDVRDKLADSGEFRYIDEDWGQLDEYNPNPPTKWPCALVDVIDAKPESLGKQMQLLNCSILIRVASYRRPSSQNATAAMRYKSEELFRIAQNIFAHLHGWHKPGSRYGSLNRAAFRRMRRDDGIREYQILFTSTLKDITAATEVTDRSPDVPEVFTPKITVKRK